MPSTARETEGTIKKELLRRVAIKATRELEMRYFLEPEEPGKNPLVLNMEKFLAGAFKDYADIRREMAMFASVLLGTEIKLRTPQRIKYPRLAVVVPLTNVNSHNYELNRPCMVVTSLEAIRGDGSRGNHLPDITGSHIRPATLEEIDAFIEAVPQAELDNKLADLETFLS